MKKIIVTTTINPPTEAVERFDALTDWELLVMGDTKTPSDYKLKRGEYWDIDKQFEKYPDLSHAIGVGTISRRNIGFVEAYNQGADVIAVIDDDNIPYPNWGKNLVLGRTVKVDCYHCDDIVFDPLAVTNQRYLWHRGFPLQLVHKRRYPMRSWTEITPWVQADLWDGDPDIDAVCRMIYKPEIKFGVKDFYTSDKVAPFNSQNTFVYRPAIPYYCMLPGTGRMDDIWGSYILQRIFSKVVVYGPASVYQKRNPHNLIADMKKEYLGYEHSLEFLEFLRDNPVQKAIEKFCPPEALETWNAYRKEFSE